MRARRHAPQACARMTRPPTPSAARPRRAGMQGGVLTPWAHELGAPVVVFLSVGGGKQAGGQLGQAAWAGSFVSSWHAPRAPCRAASPPQDDESTPRPSIGALTLVPKLAAAPKLLPARPTEAARLGAEAACPAAEAACRCFFNRDPEGMRGTFRSHKNLHVRETRLAAGRRTERTNEASRRRRELPAPPPKSSARVWFV